MAAKKIVPFQAPGRRFVYDNDPEAVTRPDTVPAALRFLVDEETDADSGFGHRVQRELSAYPGVPEMTRQSDVPTVVEAPLQRAAMHTPRVTEAYPTIPSEVPRSGPRHRMVSTVPPPRARRSRDAASPVAAPPAAAPCDMPLPVPASRGVVAQVAASPAAPSDEQRRSPQLRSDALVAARPQRTWPLLIVTSVTTVLAVVVGTSLADGTLARWSPTGFDAPALQARGTLVPRIPMPAPRPVESLRVLLTPAAADDVPVVRLEDLPLAEQDEGSTPPRHVLRGRRGLRAQ